MLRTFIAQLILMPGAHEKEAAPLGNSLLIYLNKSF
jgi:hypothetical protein